MDTLLTWTVMVVIASWLQLQLHMQSVLITINEFESH